MQAVGSVEAGVGSSEFVMDGRLRFMDRLLASTFLLFRDNHRLGSPISIWRLILALFLLSLVGYQACYSVYYTINFAKEVSLAAALMVVSWMIQEVFSIMFIIYWQLNGHFAKAFTALVMNSEKLEKSNFLRKRLRIMYIFFGLAIAAILFLVFSSLWMYYWGDLRVVNFDPRLLEGFGGRGTGIISCLVIGYAIYVWLIVLVFYIIVSSRVQQELEKFNSDLKQIGDKSPDSKELINAELIQQYERQMDLTVSLRLINGMFEVYAFIMIATNIPTTIFTLLNFIQRLKITLFAILVHLPELLFCIVELVGLTMPPAKIHALVHAVEGIIFSNKKIWIPHNQSTHQLASILILHSQQSDLGLSLWGYATITKSLILTTVSLTVTYLALLLEMGSNEVVPQIFDATAKH